MIHLLATPFLVIQWAIVFMIPVLLRTHDEFRASEWQVAISTAAIPLMMLLSVFWNEVYRRMRPARYLLLIWVVGIAPLAGMAKCHHSETALVFVVISAVGFGAMTPLAGDIIRSCYPPGVRSRVFSVLQVLGQATVMISAYAIGLWLEIDGEAFRVYLPIGVMVIGVGMYLLARITHLPLFVERQKAHPTEPLLSSLGKTLHNMVAVFARDRDFRRYETAFFIYGVGWMVCNALLPFLMVDKLGLNYEEVARSTQTAFQLVLMLTIIPVGYLMDRLGPIRLSSWSFAILAFYPVALIFAWDANSLMMATLCLGLGISGVNLAWTMGPLTLAKDASQAPHYLAIHGTMVGFRALLGQLPAVALYKLAGRTEPPLVLAILLFGTGALLMLRLNRDHVAERVRELPEVPIPPPHSRSP